MVVLELLGRQAVLSTVVFVVVLAVTTAMKRRAPLLQLCLWTLVFVRLLLPPGLSHPLSLGALTDWAMQGLPVAWAQADVSAGVEGSAHVATTLTASGRADVHSPPVWPAILLAFWAAGVGALGLVYARRVTAVRRMVGDATEVEDEVVLGNLHAWRCRFGLRRPVRLVSGEALVSPLTLGWLRPVIFIPSDVLRNPQLAEIAIAHEMAHVARWDSAWARLQHVLQILYFFHPVVWFAGARLDDERERVCDAMVLGSGHLGPRDYAAGLLRVLALGLRGAAAPTFNSRNRRLAMRTRSILGDTGRAPARLRAVLLAVMTAVFLLPLGPVEVPVEAAVGDHLTSNPELQIVPQAALQDTTPAAEFGNPLPEGRVTQAWGPSRNPWTHEVNHHRGIDLAAKMGTAIRAPADGTVIVATEEYEEVAAGTVVVIDHGQGWSTFYSHLSELRVEAGQQVTRGEVVATVGNTGRSTGPHLHFEVRRDGEPVDPAEHVQGWTRVD